MAEAAVACRRVAAVAGAASVGLLPQSSGRGQSRERSLLFFLK